MFQTRNKNNVSFAPNESLIDNDLDFTSMSSNDVLATVDGVRFQTDNVSTLYQNAAKVDEKMASMFSNMATNSLVPWSKTRLLFLLCPVMVIEYVRSSAGILMLVNSYFSFPIANVSMITSSLIGMITLQTVSWKLRSLEIINRRKIITYFILYQIFLTVWTVLLLIVTKVISAEVDAEMKENSSASSMIPIPMHDVTTHYAQRDKTTPYTQQDVTTHHTQHIIISVLLMLGYSVSSSTTGSGQYCVVSFLFHFKTGVSNHLTSSIITGWTAVGGVLAGLVGLLATSIDSSKRHQCLNSIASPASIVASIGLIFHLICLFASLCSIYLGYLQDLINKLKTFLKTRYVFLDEENQQHSNLNTTAQEEFDETSRLLLQASGTSFASSQYATHSVSSRNTLLDADESELTRKTNIKLYAHQLPVTIPTLSKLLRRKDFLYVIATVSLVSILSATFQFYSSTFPFTKSSNIRQNVTLLLPSCCESPNANNTSTVLKNDGCSSLYLDKTSGVQTACSGLLAYNLILLVIYSGRSWISDWIRPGWKPWVCPVLFLLFVIMSISLAITRDPIVYILTSILFGGVRLVETHVMHHVVRQVDKSWPNQEPYIVISKAKTFLWTLVSASLAVAAILTVPIAIATGHQQTPIVVIMTLAGILGLCFIFSGISIP